MGVRLGAALGACVLAGCSFAPSGLGVPSLGDDDDVPIDARVIDAPGEPDAILTCTDSDQDGVCNDDDQCNGHDDRQDADGDNEADGCDPWDCAQDVPTVTFPITIDGLEIRQVSIAAGGAVEDRDRNTTSAFVVNYGWVDPTASDQDQLEFGVADGNRLACRRPTDEILDWTAPPIAFATGNSPRVYRLTAQVAHENNCSSGPREDGWADDAPNDPIIGFICVR